MTGGGGRGGEGDLVLDARIISELERAHLFGRVYYGIATMIDITFSSQQIVRSNPTRLALSLISWWHQPCHCFEGCVGMKRYVQHPISQGSLPT